MRDKYKTLILVSILVLLFFFNLRYLSRFFDWDSSVYALNIQRDRVHSVFFNPHHLGFESTGLLTWKWIQAFFPEADLMFTLRVRILAFSMVFLYFFIRWMDRLYGSFSQALLLAGCVSVTQAFWFYSHHNDTPLIHSCLVVLLYLYLVDLSRNGLNARKLAVLGLLQLGTLYFHQSNAILFPMVMVGVLLTPTWRNRPWAFSKRLYTAALLCLAVGITIVLSYIVVGFGILGRELGGPWGEKQFSYWLFLYAAQERWGMSTGEKNYVLYFYRGIGDAFLNFQGVNAKVRVDFLRDWDAKNTPYNLNLLFWISLLGLGILNMRGFVRKFSAESLLLFFWLIPSVLFYSWWEGYFFEFWVGVSTGFWILGFLVLKSWEWSVFPMASRALVNGILAMGVLVFFTVNFTFSTLPRSEKIQYGYLEGFKDRVEKIARERIYWNNN